MQPKENGSLTDIAIRGFLWVFGGTVAQLLSRLVALMVLARLLTPADFGIVGAALVIVGLSQVFSQFGVGPALVQRADLNERHIATALTLSLLLGVLVAIATFMLAGAIASAFRMPQLEQVLQVLSLVFPIAGYGVTFESLLKRDMKFKVLSLIEGFSYLAGYLVVGISLALLGYGLWALVGAHFGQIVIKSIGVRLAVSGPVALGIHGKELRSLSNYGAGFSLAKLGNYSAGKLDQFVVGRWLGADALGAYGRAYEFIMMPATVLGTVVDKVLFPVMASVQDDKEKLGRAFILLNAIVFMVAIPISLFLFIFAPELIYLLLGPNWSSVVAPFQILSTVIVFRTGYKISDSLARAVGAVYRRAWRQWVFAAMVFLGKIIGQYWGLAGAAVGVSGAIFTNYLIMSWLGLKLLSLPWSSLALSLMRHATIGAILLAMILALRYGLPNSGINEFVGMFLAVFFPFSLYALVLIKFTFLLGKEGAWVKDEILYRFKEKVNRFIGARGA